METDISSADGLTPSEGTSSTMDRPSSRSTSQIFAEQIRQLETEGSKLLEATEALSNSVVTPSTLVNEPNSLTKHSTSANLTALTDITAEQKTIDDLRSYLDAQTRETERLQRSLAEPGGNLSRYPLTSRSSSLSALNLPLTTPLSSSSHHRDPPPELGFSNNTFSSSLGVSNGSSGYLTRHSQLNSTQSYMDRQVRDLQDEVTGLRNRLKQALSLGEEQKHQFRSAQEDLKRQMTSLINNKDAIIDTKTRELAAQETHVSRLQATAERMEQTNRLQEQALDEANHKLETLQKDRMTIDTVSSQLRRILTDRENRSVKPFSETETLSSQPVTKLVHHVERYTIGLETNIEDLTIRLKQANAELDILKSSSLEKHHSISRNHQDRLTELADIHDKELTQAVERSMQARTQLATLQEQLALLRQESSEKLADKDGELSRLRRELETTTQNHSRLEEEWRHKKEALEAAMDASQRELSELKRDQDGAIYLRAKLESKVDELQLAITKQEGELESHRACEVSSKKELEQFQHELKMAREEAEEREQLVRHLQATVQTAKMESSAQLQTAVASLEREEKERSACQVQSVTERLAETSEKLTSLNLEHEVLKAEHKNLSDRHTELQTTHTEMIRKLDSTVTTKESLSQTLQERMTDIGRLSQDRDYYIKASEQRSKEVTDLQTEIDKLAVQLEERQKNFLLLKEQNEKLNTLLTETTESARGLREERDRLAEQNNSTTTDSDRLKHSHEHLTKKLKIREKHLKDLQEDNREMATLLAANKEELEQLVREKDAIFTELKDSRYDVLGLKETNEQLTTKLKESEENSQREMEKITKKLKATEDDLKIAKKAMKTKEQVDGKAVRVAGKMQREVTEKRGQIDTLQSKLRWLEECMENLVKERKVLKDETERLGTNLKRSVVQNERLTNDMAAMSKREVDMRQRLNKYESALEKAAVKHAAAQAQIEQLEQDIARLKLKHQLDIKELARSGKPVPQSAPQTSTPLVVEVSAPGIPASSTNYSPHQPATYQHLNKPQPEQDVLAVSVGRELRELLGEMRSLISSGNQSASPQLLTSSAPPPPAPLSSSSSSYHHPTGSSCCNHSNHQIQQHLQHSSEFYKKKAAPTSKHRASLDVRPTKMKKQPVKSYHIPDTPELVKPYRIADNIDMYPLDSLQSPSTSPVSDLLIESPITWQHEVSTITGITDDSDRNFTTQDFPASRVTTDAEMLCKRLGRKIEKLSELGNHLVMENKEIGDMMKDQDVKIKKVRNSGKLLKV